MTKSKNEKLHYLVNVCKDDKRSIAARNIDIICKDWNISEKDFGLSGNAISYLFLMKR